MESDAYPMRNTTDACVRPLPSHLLARRRTTAGAGIATHLSRKRRRTDRRVVRPWCKHCGTSHRNRVVTAECVRLIVNGPDWPVMGS